MKPELQVPGAMREHHPAEDGDAREPEHADNPFGHPAYGLSVTVFVMRPNAKPEHVELHDSNKLTRASYTFFSIKRARPQIAFARTNPFKRLKMITRRSVRDGATRDSKRYSPAVIGHERKVVISIAA